MPFAVIDALRLLGECPSPLALAFFGPENQAMLQRVLADRVFNAVGIRIGEQDLLTCMVKAYSATPHTSTESAEDVPVMNRFLLGKTAPYVVRGIKLAGFHAARYDKGVTVSRPPPLISAEALSSSYDTSVPDARRGSSLSSAPAYSVGAGYGAGGL